MRCGGKEAGMTIQQRVAAILIACAIFIVVLELVRKRRLREEYSWLWLVTGAGLILLTVRYDLLVIISRLIGAALPTSTLFFFGLIFLMLVCLQFSIRISRLTDQVKNLTQEIALLQERSGHEER